MKAQSKKRLVWLALAMVCLAVLAAGIYGRVFRRYPPPELMQDLQAAIAVRDVKNADERFGQYLERRYGSMDDPANRQKAFLDFFNVDHIRALQFMVAHSPAEQRQANIQATADWVANYRLTMTAAERAALAGQITSPEGRQMLRKATAQYNSQDVYYRGSTAPVISQLLRTIHDVEGKQ